MSTAKEAETRWASGLYPEEFRRDAARLTLDGGRSIREVARELGVNRKTLRNWFEHLRRDGPAAVSEVLREALALLARETDR